MKNTHKKRSAILVIVPSLLSLAVVVYAVITFISTQTFKTRFSKEQYFDLGTAPLITNDDVIGIGESVSIDPVLTSDASVDMYVFIRVEMPVFKGDGLYDINVDSSWTLVESGTVDGSWVEVYQFNDVLGPMQSTVALGDTMTMVDMNKAEFAELSEIDVSMTGYACKVSDTSSEEAWEFIKSEAGL